MNSYTQRFHDQKLEQKYYTDQLEELIGFFQWICFLGSISLLLVFLMEFINPIGLGNLSYFLPILPLMFLSSYMIVKSYPKLLNPILMSINIGCGITADIICYFYVDIEYMFLFGQITALVQQSLLISTDLITNQILLFINQAVLAIIASIHQKKLNSFTFVYFFVILLISKSNWSNHKLKRKFFLIKHLNNSIQNTLNLAFNIGITTCYFNTRSNQIIFQENDHNQTKPLFSQQTFTEFLRIYQNYESQSQLEKSNREKSFSNGKQNKKSLELILFNEFHNYGKTKYEYSTHVIYSNKTKKGYNVALIPTIINSQKFVIMLLQEDLRIEKVINLKQKIKKTNNSVQQFLQLTNDFQGVIAYLKYIYKQNEQQQKSKSAEVIDQNKLLISIMKLYSILRTYYNIILLNKYSKVIGKITYFELNLFNSELKQLIIYALNIEHYCISINSDLKKKLKTNYLLLMQLIINLIDQHKQQDYYHIYISYYEIIINENYCLEIQIQLSSNQYNIFDISFRNNEIIKLNDSKKCLTQEEYQKINLYILKQIGCNNQINCLQNEQSTIIKFTIFQDLERFQAEIKNKQQQKSEQLLNL